MSVETINPAEDHLDELVTGLIDCALLGRQLAQDIFDLQHRHEANLQRQIALSQDIDTLLVAECLDTERRNYLKSVIAEKLRQTVYPEQLAVGSEPTVTTPELYIVREES